jgi:hypothetical protein
VCNPTPFVAIGFDKVFCLTNSLEPSLFDCSEERQNKEQRLCLSVCGKKTALSADKNHLENFVCCNKTTHIRLRQCTKTTSVQSTDLQSGF